MWGRGATGQRKSFLNSRLGVRVPPAPPDGFLWRVPVAQLDRAPDYGSGGWGFDSLWGRQCRRGLMDGRQLAELDIVQVRLLSATPFSRGRSATGPERLASDQEVVGSTPSARTNVPVVQRTGAGLRSRSMRVRAPPGTPSSIMSSQIDWTSTGFLIRRVRVRLSPRAP